MDAPTPFFQNRSWHQKPATPRYSSLSHSPSTFGMPVYPIDTTLEMRHPPHTFQHPLPEKKSGSKVIQIPVHFFKSDSNRRFESALKIQKVFRGFLIRKSLRKIKEIKFQVEEIEAKLLTRDFVELIRQDERERLRVNETLMNLLFKLDGIRGIDLGIRNCRKGVTRKAITLQEKIDAMLAVDSQINNADNASIENQEVSTVELVKMECVAEKGSAAEMVDCKSENLENSAEYGEMLDDWREGGEGDKRMEVEGDADVIDVGVACEVRVSGVEEEIPKNLYLNDKSVKERSVESDEKCKIDEWVEMEGEGIPKKNENKRNSELLERLVEENEKMMRLMTQLFERNEMQTQMLNALTNRVELLEKAYVCDKLKNRRKKNKKSKACDSVEE